MTSGIQVVHPVLLPVDIEEVVASWGDQEGGQQGEEEQLADHYEVANDWN